MANRKSPSISTVSASPIRGIALLAALLAGSAALCLLGNYLDHLPARPEPLSPQEIAQGRVRCSFSLDKTEVAFAKAEAYLNEYPSDAAMRLETAERYEKDHQPAAALGHYQRLHKDDPRSLKAMTGIARCYAALGQKDLAILYWEEAARLSPADAKIHRELGMALRRAGENARALDALQRSLALDPDQKDLYAVISEIAQEKMSADLAGNKRGSGADASALPGGYTIEGTGLDSLGGAPRSVDPSRYMLESVRPNPRSDVSVHVPGIPRQPRQGF